MPVRHTIPLGIVIFLVFITAVPEHSHTAYNRAFRTGLKRFIYGIPRLIVRELICESDDRRQTRALVAPYHSKARGHDREQTPDQCSIDL